MIALPQINLVDIEQFLPKNNRRMYQIWNDMLRRCGCVKHHSYKNYGARGIRVSEEWKTYKNFIQDMGVRPYGLSLDRINNEKGYCKENCRWVDRKTQNNNRRMCIFVNYGGSTYTLKQAWETFSKDLGITYRSLHKRFAKGLSLEDCLFTPPLRLK